MTLEKELIRGTVTMVIFRNDENGYAVLRLDSEEYGEMTVVGIIPAPSAGERLMVTGRWTAHTSYGKQFEAEFLERLLPDTREDILEYLSSRAIKGIGPKTAQKIVAKFGENALKILDTEPERLAEISGISLTKAKDIGENYRSQIGMRRLIEFLTTNHLPVELAVRAYKLYGDHATEILQENPYILTQTSLSGDFVAIDALAKKLGIPAEDPRRVEAGILWILKASLDSGHCFLPEDKLLPVAVQLLGIEREKICEGIVGLQSLGLLEAEELWGAKALYLTEYAEAEAEVASRLLKMAKAEPKPLPDPERFIRTVEGMNGIEYAKLQRKAILCAGERKLMILTGGPGTGKTTTLAGILSLCRLLKRKTLLAAPTGRAAKRLSELTDYEASTIHRLLEAQISPQTGEMYFAKDEDDPLRCDTLIIDEMSMVDLPLMYSVLRALPEKATLILVGDPDQLPSVGPGKVFEDLIACGRIETIALKEIFRQARESLIVTNAHSVNCGELPVLHRKDGDFFFMRRANSKELLQTVTELCAQRLPKYQKISPMEIQVIAPSRKGETGTVNLNRVLQEALNPASRGKCEIRSGDRIFREGDRVMQIRNNYDLGWRREDGVEGLGVFNGDCGTILRIDRKEEQLLIQFDDRWVYYDMDLLSELELAYAITAHKSQGCEYKAVVFVAYDAAYQLLNRSVLYTAMTRAKDLMVIVGKEQIVANMTVNHQKNKRYCGLQFRLQQEE
ncbi:MAG: ATP-dependent RecD-like DNA helicase [Oscillospiraceae bacterium]|nr:ATP-dependent RecD-like DNA helicase [Oscillospiraceae bacterium]